MSLLDVGGILYFVADDRPSGAELWKTDGTAAGTVLVQDLRLGPQDSFPHGLIALGGRLFFVADDGISGQELWALNLA